MAKITLKLPKPGVTVTEAVLTQWHKEDGDKVAPGDLLYTIETDKSAMDVPSPFGGTFTRLAAVGETYPVGAPICEIVT